MLSAWWTCRWGFVAMGVLELAAVLPAAAEESLEPDVRAQIARQGLSADKVAAVIIDDRGRILASINGSKPFQPASNQKILTTAAALHALGPEFRYVTTLTAAGPIRGGVLEGDLVLRGTGDPNISSRFYSGGPATLFRDWARALRERGLHEVGGDLLADESYFDGVRWPPSWDRRQEETWYSAQISALSLNDNCLDVIVRPASAVGKPARVEIVPACALLELEGAPETTAGGAAKVVVHRKPGTNTYTVRGQIPLRHAPWTGNVTLDDPALVFASSFAAVLKEEGIVVRGKVRKAAPGEKLATAQGMRLVEHTSTLAQDLPIILKRSQNLHAEVLLRALGANAGGEGSVAGGERAVRAYLKSQAIPDQALILVDGSGLSHENRVTADLLARVLHSIRKEKYFPAYLEALPIAGKDGTLDERFARSTVKGKLYAKTGYIHGVSCLSGYVVKDGKVATFSVLVNGIGASARAAKRLQEAVGELIYSRI